MKGRGACRLATGTATTVIASTMFVSYYKAFKLFETAGLCVEVANNYGNGTGFNYADEASPIGTSGTFVFRFPPTAKRAYSLYVVCHYAQSAAASVNAKINNAAFNSYGCVGVTFAAALDSGGADASPLGANWTTLRAGADVKGNPTFAVPEGGKCWVGDRSNSQPDGDNKTAMGNLHRLYTGNYGTSTAMRWGVTLDADNVLFYADMGDDGQPLVVAAVMLERDAASIAACPFGHAVFRFDLADALASTVKGTSDGYGSTEFTVPFTAAGDAKLAGLIHTGAAAQSALQPSSLVSRYAEGAVELFVTDGAAVGVAGSIERYTLAAGVFPPWLGIVSNINNGDTLAITAARQRVVYGGTTQAAAKITGPWDAATDPQTAATGRDGVDF